MQQPGAWIVSLEGQNGIAAGAGNAIVALNEMGVAADWVVELVGWVEGAVAGGNDPEVVAVQMEGMWKWRLVDNQVIDPTGGVDDYTVIAGWKRICAVEDV
jgi:hypothetical protein